ncbi:MAG: ribokinase [Opitutales bacterium]
MPPKITVIGSSNVDFVMRAPRLPSPGETVGGAEFSQVFGGKGANQAVAAARAGAAVTFFTALGDDPYAPMMLENFASDGIDTSLIRRETEVATGAALIVTDPAGENSITVAAGANGGLSPETLAALDETLANSDWLIAQMEIPVETTRALIEAAERHGKPLLLNFAPIVDAPLDLSRGVAALVVNESEAGALLGAAVDVASEAELAEAAIELRRRGPEIVVITLGGHGAYACDATGGFLLPPPSVTAVDTVGAGDTFCGYLTVAMAEGRELREAVCLANAAGALAASRPSAQPSVPQRGEVEAIAGIR